MNALQSIVQHRIGPARARVNDVRPSRPRRLDAPRPVAVVGGGLAGLSAATILAERGFAVTVFERDAFLGGKVGSWPTTLPSGETQHVSHGFHAFFRQYHNLRALLDRVGASAHLRPIDDDLILTHGSGRFGFRDLETTPIANVVSMAQQGFFSAWEAMVHTDKRRALELLRYEQASTFERLDAVDFATFSKQARFPTRLDFFLRMLARAFFAAPEHMSTAELIKAIHFYVMSNDLGLVYDYMADDFSRTLLDPWRRYLEARGAEIRLETPVDRIARAGEGFDVDGQAFDAVVVAADVPGVRAVLGRSPVMDEDPELGRRLGGLRASRPYAVLRVWTDRRVDREDLPPFLLTERRRYLDSITFVHRAEAESRAWADRHDGGVYELHCYACDDGCTQKDVEAGMLAEAEAFVPELRGAGIVHRYGQFRADFAALHAGLWHQRPTTHTRIRGLSLAGDWVKLPYPAMLMEAACTSGILAANGLLESHALQLEAVTSVPLRGVLA